MAEKLTWEQYVEKFPQPYNIAQYVGTPIASYPPNYDEMRKANMKWQAEFFLNHDDYSSPLVLLNPFVRGGWYYNIDGSAEWIPNPNPQPAIDWAAEAAAGHPVIGPVVAPSAVVPVKPAPSKPKPAPSKLTLAQRLAARLGL